MTDLSDNWWVCMLEDARNGIPAGTYRTPEQILAARRSRENLERYRKHLLWMMHEPIEGPRARERARERARQTASDDGTQA